MRTDTCHVTSKQFFGFYKPRSAMFDVERKMGCVPTLQDSDCYIEFPSSVCGHLDLLVQGSERSAKKELDGLSVSVTKSSPTSSAPTIHYMPPPRRFEKSNSSDRMMISDFQQVSGDDRMLVRLHRQAVCFELANSERRRSGPGTCVSKDDVKMIYESLND